MKRKYREAMRASAHRIWDSYVDGVSEDEQARELLTWYDEYTPPRQTSSAEYHLDEQQLPF